MIERFNSDSARRAELLSECFDAAAFSIASLRGGGADKRQVSVAGAKAVDAVVASSSRRSTSAKARLRVFAQPATPAAAAGATFVLDFYRAGESPGLAAIQGGKAADTTVLYRVVGSVITNVWLAPDRDGLAEKGHAVGEAECLRSKPAAAMRDVFADDFGGATPALHFSNYAELPTDLPKKSSPRPPAPSAPSASTNLTATKVVDRMIENFNSDSATRDKMITECFDTAAFSIAALRGGGADKRQVVGAGAKAVGGIVTAASRRSASVYAFMRVAADDGGASAATFVLDFYRAGESPGLAAMKAGKPVDTAVLYRVEGNVITHAWLAPDRDGLMAQGKELGEAECLRSKSAAAMRDVLTEHFGAAKPAFTFSNHH
jgi:hypothetical protein